MRLDIKEKIPAIVLFVFFSCLYIYTVAPTVYSGDSGEIAAAVNTLGLAHPTGFPLYMLAGKLFTLLVPIGDVAYRLNIFSALLTASSLVFLFYAFRNLGNSSFSSLAAIIILGFGRNTIWSNAGTARVYALSLFFVSVLLFILSKWRNKQEIKYLYWYGFLWGLSLGTHALMLILGIPFLLMLWQAWSMFKSKISVFLKTILLVVLPGIQYVYLFFAYKRNSIVTWGDMSSFDGFVYYITQRQYTYKMFARTWSGTMTFLDKIGSLLTTEFTIIFFVIALIGLAAVYKRRKSLFLLLVAMAVANVGIMFSYGNSEGDILVLFRYLFIVDVVLALAVAFSLDEMMSALEVFKSNKRVVFFSILIIAAIFIQFKYSYAFNNRRYYYLVEDTATNMLNNVEPNAVIFSYIDHVYGPLWYLQSIGYRKDVVIVVEPFMIHDWYIKNMAQKYPDVFGEDLITIKSENTKVRTLIKDNLSNRPVYSVFNSLGDPASEKDFDFVSQGLLNRIIPKGSDKKKLIIANNYIWDKYNMRDVRSAGYYKEESIDFLVKLYALALYSGGVAYYNVGLTDQSLNMLKRSFDIFPYPKTQEWLDYITHK